MSCATNEAEPGGVEECGEEGCNCLRIERKRGPVRGGGGDDEGRRERITVLGVSLASAARDLQRTIRRLKKVRSVALVRRGAYQENCI